MNAAGAFAAGAGMSPANLALLIGGAGGVAILLWGGWALLSGWRGWAANRVRGGVFGAATVRIALLIVLFIWIF